MLRTMSYRTAGTPFAGEPEAWDARSDTRRHPAPWYNPYAEERASASDFARRPAPAARARPAERRPSPRTEYRGLTNAATADDFRNLARSIEDLRASRARAAEPAHRERRPAASGGWPAPRDSAPVAVRSAPAATRLVRPVREAAPAREPVTRHQHLGALARDIASAADKTDVRRLERLLNEVLHRLDALEHAQEPPRRERRDTREEAAPARRTLERRASEPPPARDRAAETRQRPTSARRPSDYGGMDASPHCAPARGSKPRRLFT